MAAITKNIVLITGANTGLGFQVARKLLREHSDKFHVLIGARTPSKGEAAVQELHDQGLKQCEFVSINVTNNESIAKAAEHVKNKFGRLDVLHANAGIAPEGYMSKAPIADIINTAMQTNVAGAAQTAESFVPLLQQAENPRIIFMSTGIGSLTRAHKVTNKNWPAYAASKAALNMIMLYYYHSHPGMKVNACAPGFRATQLNNFGQGGSVQAGKTEDGANNAVRLSLLGKDGESGTHTEMVDATGEIVTIPW